VSEKIEERDIEVKINYIKKLREKGEYKFKIITENDSMKSEKLMRRMCEMLKYNYTR
jgi:hypothetical protein